MLEKACSLGMRVMAGSINESAIGTAAIAYLTPLLDYVNMDGPLLLKEDIAKGLIYKMGRLYFPVCLHWGLTGIYEKAFLS